MSVLGLLKLNVIESFFMSGNPDFYQLALKDIPVLANGGQGAWTGFLLFSIILFILGIVTCLFIYFDCKAFGSLAAVNRVLGNSLFYVKNIEQGISDSIDSGSEYMFRAARTGINTHLERNSNSALVLKAENEIRTAIDFINKRPVKLHIAVLLAFVLIAGISALVYSPGVAKVFEDIVTMAEVEEEEQPTQRPTHKPTQKPTPKPTPTPTPTQTPKPETYYIVRKSDITWESANNEAEYEGGYLVSINDAEEFSEICSLADGAGIKVLWVGAKRAAFEDWEDVDWNDFSKINYIKWLKNEPTYVDENGADELYLMIFKVGNEWYFNDAVNDVSSYYKGKIGYIIEVEE